jgi:hypothetical protein
VKEISQDIVKMRKIRTAHSPKEDPTLAREHVPAASYSTLYTDLDTDGTLISVTVVPGTTMVRPYHVE